MLRRILRASLPSERSDRDLEEWESAVHSDGESVASRQDLPAPAEQSPMEQSEAAPAPSRGHEETVITGYWAAPTIRGLTELGPRKKDSLRLGASGSQENAEAAVEPARIDPNRLSALAGEIQRCNRELDELLHQLTGGIAGPDASHSSGQPTAKSKSTAKKTRRKNPLEVIKNRVFMPQGVLSVAPVRAMRAQISKGRLFFPCPACNQVTELYANMAGQDTRCPNCYSAIRAPHPKKGIKGRNREQDKEALLNPGLFMVTVPESRQGLFSPIQSLKKVPLVKGFAFAVLLAAVIKVCLLSLTGKYADQQSIEQHARADKKESVLYAGSGELRGRAEETVRGFLRAESWPEKAQFVRSHDKIISRMESYYAIHPEEAAADYISITSNAPAHSVPGDIDYPLTEVVVQFENYDLAVFRVEHLPEGDLIEWESSVGFNPVEWGEIVEIGTIREMERIFRVLAAPDDYYNFHYDRSKYLCVRLQDPSDNTLMAYGYIPRASAEAKELDFMLGSASPEKPRRLMVEIKFDRDSMKTRQVRLVGLVQDGWRVETGIMVSSAQ